MYLYIKVTIQKCVNRIMFCYPGVRNHCENNGKTITAKKKLWILSKHELC